MSQHKATIAGKLAGSEFLKGKYSREHTWAFDGGIVVAASPAPSVVPAPWSNPANVDPEEAFVASVSSCHMLTYLWVAMRKGFTVESYTDEAVGIMAKAANGIPWVSKITLNVAIVYSGDKQPTKEDEAHLHHAAHEQCFIANSIKTEVVVAGFEGS